MKKLNAVAYPAIVALGLMAAVSAHAENPSIDDSATQKWAVTKTRAQVQAELAQARADGSMKVWSSNYNPVLVTTYARTRDEVRAEAIAANRANHAGNWYGEDSGSIVLSRQAPAAPAAPIYAGTVKPAR
jgi:hypothetical protein